MSEYKRLTNKDWKENYDIFEDVCCDTCTENCGKCERNFNALVRLAELEDKIENGMLVELPCNCKIGDLVYGVADFLSKPKLGILTCVEITKYCIQYGIVDKRLMRHNVKYVYYPAEKEAAEAKLKELQEAKK